MFDANGHRFASNSTFKFPAFENQLAWSPASSTTAWGSNPTKTGLSAIPSPYRDDSSSNAVDEVRNPSAFFGTLHTRTIPHAYFLPITNSYVWARPHLP